MAPPMTNRPAAAAAPAVAALKKDLPFLISILPTSHSLCSSICRRTDDAPHTKSNDNSERIMWSSARAWGVASVSLLLMLIFPPLHSWASADAPTTSSSSSAAAAAAAASGFSSSKSLPTPSSLLSSRHSVLAPSSFKEAPRVRNGRYCFSSSRTTPADLICDPASVHIAMTLDAAYLRGSMAAVFSVLQHASCPENVIFHFLVMENDAQFQDLIMSTFPFLSFKIYHFDPSLVRDRISSSVRQALEQPLNYARNYLSELLEPCVERVIYLDSDLVVVDDIFKLWNTTLGSHIIGAPEYCHANFTKYFSPAFWADPSLSSTFSGRNPCYFNTGVMIMDLVKWRSENCTRRIELWMKIQKERRIYELGSLPPFLLVFAGFVQPVEHRWNQHGLGGDNVKGSCRPLHPGPVSLLHWSGEGKPWTRLDSRQPCPLDSLWAPYDLFLNSLY